MKRMDEFARTEEPFDIYFWFELFTMDLMGELALGNNFGVLEAGKPARYSTLVELSQRFGNLSGVLPFGKYSKKILSWVPLPYVQMLWKARVEYLEYARHALEKRFQNDRAQVKQSGKQRQDIMQRFIEASDPETGRKMDFDELRAETSSLMCASHIQPNCTSLTAPQGRRRIHRQRNNELDDILPLQKPRYQSPPRQRIRHHVSKRKHKQISTSSIHTAKHHPPPRTLRNGMSPPPPPNRLRHAPRHAPLRRPHLHPLHPRRYRRRRPRRHHRAQPLRVPLPRVLPPGSLDNPHPRDEVLFSSFWRGKSAVHRAERGEPVCGQDDCGVVG